MGCKNDLQELEDVEALYEVNVEIGKDVEILYTEKGKPHAKLVAKKVTRYLVENPYAEFEEGVKVYMFNADGEIESSLKADNATVYENQESMFAKDNVEVININGDKLNTEELIWDQKSKKIKSNTFVKFRTADEIITGTGFSANDDMTQYTITDVRGRVKIDEEGLGIDETDEEPN